MNAIMLDDLEVGIAPTGASDAVAGIPCGVAVVILFLMPTPLG